MASSGRNGMPLQEYRAVIQSWNRLGDAHAQDEKNVENKEERKPRG